ncbi:Crp/Fnr family transcriptional regulator [Chelatococcus sp. SYSU_G07232]|uniref:Crp/Fnr family transcriptional regulator n=1 Tax=Chelatococcus albus TaxID=3047466 RepID=A0ABT7AFS2_9HYPH|nr:Crp/Fnr family transcriptional regulator [Chelatococcus sp. SYSU_G07232]MDJ1158209.1 Crp/Fnr family transcriptional regulator [Chelatococcus sp. SYSU_G07232]
MSHIDRSLIAELPLFADMPAAALDDILHEARSLRYPKGKAVFQQNEEAHSFFVLLHGRLRVTQVTADGQQIVVRFVGPGEIFGVAQAIGRKDYPGTATAVTDSIALAWPASAWQPMIARYPQLASRTLQTVGGRLQDAHSRLREISTEQVERRVARALLRLTHQAGRKTPEGVLVDFPVTRQDIAELTGTTLYTVSRILSAWESNGWVEGGRQRILVRDPHRIFLLAEGDGT